MGRQIEIRRVWYGRRTWAPSTTLKSTRTRPLSGARVMFRYRQNRILDWAAGRRTIYKQIIAKYDQMAVEADLPKKKPSAGNQRADGQSRQAWDAHRILNLMESIGGKNVNAGTSFDLTYYHSSFPHIKSTNGWKSPHNALCILYSVPSSPELENVYEEYNMYQDNQQRENQFVIRERHSRDILIHVTSSGCRNI